MNYIILAVFCVAVLHALLSLVIGLIWFFRRSRSKEEPLAVAIRSTLPLLFAAILTILYFKQGFTAYEVLITAAVLYGCEFWIILLVDRKLKGK